MAQPEIWPLNDGEDRHVIESYQSGCAQMRAKRSSGLHECLENKKRKVESELEKVRKDAWDAKFDVSNELLKSLRDDLRDILSTLQRKLDVAKDKLAYVKEKAKGNDKPSNSTIIHPVPSLMMGDSLGYPPHSYQLQLPPQGRPDLCHGNNLGGCAGSRLTCNDEEARHKAGICEDWIVLNHGVHEGKIRYPWQLFEGSQEDVAGFFIPGLLDEDEPSWNQQVSF